MRSCWSPTVATAIRRRLSWPRPVSRAGWSSVCRRRSSSMRSPPRSHRFAVARLRVGTRDVRSVSSATSATSLRGSCRSAAWSRPSDATRTPARSPAWPRPAESPTWRSPRSSARRSNRGGGAQPAGDPHARARCQRAELRDDRRHRSGQRGSSPPSSDRHRRSSGGTPSSSTSARCTTGITAT